ncbi:hypothetical protein OROHE_023134 [Orobanche hederae]
MSIKEPLMTKRTSTVHTSLSSHYDYNAQEQLVIPSAETVGTAKTHHFHGRFKETRYSPKLSHTTSQENEQYEKIEAPREIQSLLRAGYGIRILASEHAFGSIAQEDCENQFEKAVLGYLIVFKVFGQFGNGI